MSQDARPVALIADKLVQSTMDALGDSVEIRWVGGPNRVEPLAAINDANTLLVRSATTMDQEVLEAAPNLGIVGRASMGPDNVDINTAAKYDIMVVSAPASNIHSACEHIIALLLATAHQLPATGVSLYRGEWERSSLKSIEIFGKIAGIADFGHIGQLFVQCLVAFETSIIAYDPYANPTHTVQLGVELVKLGELMARANFVTIRLSKIREATGVFNAELLGKAKKGRIIISIARGGLIDEQALTNAIRAGNAHGVGLDVHAIEPCTDSLLFDPPGTIRVLYPGASAVETQDHAGTNVVKSILPALVGEFVPDTVNASGGVVSKEVALWFGLAHELGLITGGLLEGTPAAVEVTARGKLHAGDVNVLGMATICGLFSLMAGEPVTFVNTPRIAGERDVTFTAETKSKSVSRRSVLEVKVIGVDGSAATIIGAPISLNRIKRIVHIDGRGIDMRAQGRNLFLLHKDVPGILGRATTTLSESGTNIEATTLSPQEADQVTILVLRISKEVPEEFVEKITEETSATHALQLELGQF